MTTTPVLTDVIRYPAAPGLPHGWFNAMVSTPVSHDGQRGIPMVEGFGGLTHNEAVGYAKAKYPNLKVHELVEEPTP